MAAGMTKHHRRALPGGLSHSLQFPELIFCFQHSCGYRSHLILGPEPRCLLLVLIDPHPESLPPLIASPAQPVSYICTHRSPRADSGQMHGHVPAS